MQTKGIKEVLVETHNWGTTVAFWKDLGYELEFETDHHSGRLRHPSGGLSIVDSTLTAQIASCKLNKT
jgi:hypothetical protein